MKPTIREVLDSALGDDHYDAVLAERVEAVLRLHKPFRNTKYMPGPQLCSACMHGDGPLSASWPCPTIRALEGEESRDDF